MSTFNIDSYLAGFFDGEGTICMCRRRDRNAYDLRVCVGQRECRVLNLFKSRFGGDIYLLNVRGVPSIYQWSLRKKSKIAKFLKAMAPMLVIKREEALMAIPFLKLMRSRSKGKYNHKRLTKEEIDARDSLYHEMKMIKVNRSRIHYQPPLFSNQ